MKVALSALDMLVNQTAPPIAPLTSPPFVIRVAFPALGVSVKLNPKYVRAPYIPSGTLAAPPSLVMTTLSPAEEAPSKYIAADALLVPEFATTKFWTLPELFMIPPPLKVRTEGKTTSNTGVTVIV